MNAEYMTEETDRDIHRHIQTDRDIHRHLKTDTDI